MERALGLIEVVGMVAAVEAMDAAVKAADVTLTGLENSRGNGRMTLKIRGEVGAVKAAVEAAVYSAGQLGEVIYAYKVIARPSEGLGKMLIGVPKPGTGGQSYAGKSEDEPEGSAEPSVKAEKAQSTATCNLCRDPQCSRVRGEAKIKCIHYNEQIKK